MEYYCIICGYKWKEELPLEVVPAFCKRCHKTNWEIGYNCICNICNRIVFVPTLHHIDGNHYNNRIDNRIFVCTKCHVKIHRGKNREYNDLLVYSAGKKIRRNYRKKKKQIKEFSILAEQKKLKNFKDLERYKFNNS
jgi:hypothetical protein